MFLIGTVPPHENLRNTKITALKVGKKTKVTSKHRWAGPQLVPLCAFPQLVQQGNLLRMCALIRRQLTAELRLRTKKCSCGPYFHYAQYRR
jgi:hypothetical protein